MSTGMTEEQERRKRTAAGFKQARGVGREAGRQEGR